MTNSTYRPTDFERLFNVPVPGYYESASCWLSRLALSQGVTLQELLRYFGWTAGGDIDRRLRGYSLSALRVVCGLPDRALSIHDRIMNGYESLGEVGIRYLMETQKGRPRFRFCPLCFSQMRTPYFPIHWRFVTWRWCPDHDCLLEDRCPHCAAEISFPTNIADSVAGQMGYGFLNHCLSCGASLSEVEPCFLSVNGIRRISDLEAMSLRNGRALLAALYYGRFKIIGEPNWLHPKKFRILEKRGVLPVRADWLTPDSVRTRVLETYLPKILN